MKVYMIVTNDELETPVKEAVGGKAAAEFLDISRELFYKYMVIGFPRKYKYKVIVLEDMLYCQTEDSRKERGRYTQKRWRMNRDMTEINRKNNERRKNGKKALNTERDNCTV